MQHIRRVAARHDGTGRGVQKNAVVGNGKDARQFVRHYDECCPEGIAQFQNEVVQQSGTDGVQPGRRLVQKQHVGIKGHGPRQPGTLAHAAADLAGIIIFKARQPGQRQLERRQFPDFRIFKIGVLLQGEPHIFRQRHGAPQRAALKQDADTAHQPLPDILSGIPEILPAVENTSPARRFQAHEHAQQRTFAAAGTAHDEKDIPLPHIKIHIPHQHVVAIGNRQIAGGNARRVGRNERVHNQMRSRLQMMVMMAVATMMPTSECTTAVVVARPTARALRPQRMP